MKVRAALAFIHNRLTLLGLTERNVAIEPVVYTVSDNSTLVVPDTGARHFAAWHSLNDYPVGGILRIRTAESFMEGNYTTWSTINNAEHYGEMTLEASGIGRSAEFQFFKVTVHNWPCEKT